MLRAHPGYSFQYSSGEIAEVISQTIVRGRIFAPTVPCPSCDARGYHAYFTAKRYTCEVCEGATTVTQQTADAETARQKDERDRWR